MAGRSQSDRVTQHVVHVASGREWRGGQRQVWLLARELQRFGDLTQTVVTGAGSELARRLRQDGIPVDPVSWSAGLDPRVVPALLTAVRGRPALLHAHDAHAVTLAGICAWLSHKPLVATRRVDFHLRRPGCWARAARVIAISDAVAAILAADGIDPALVTVVRSGIQLDGPPPVPLGIRGQLGLAPEAFIAANVAALVAHKDQATLVRAAALLRTRAPALHWVVAGEGPLKVALERLIADLGVSDRVHLLGHIDEPARLLADANLFVMSSREEGLGTAVLDAMALGIPVASTAAGGLPEMLGDGAGLLVTPEDPAALADAVYRLLDDAELRRRLAETARAVVQRFSAARMAAEVRSVYRSCASLP
jgi:glycosyltransferase involved in cell wall biosynthesis